VNLSITMNRRKIISKLDIWTVSGKNDSYTTTFQKSTELESQHAPVNQFCTIVLLKTTDNRHRQDSCLHRWNAPHQWNIRRDNPADHTRHGQNSSRHHHPRAPHRLENYTSHQSRNAPGPYPGTRRHPSPIRIEKQSPPNANTPSKVVKNPSIKPPTLKNTEPPGIPWESPGNPLGNPLKTPSPSRKCQFPTITIP